MKIARFMHQGRTGYGVVIDEAGIVEPSAGFLARHPDIRSVLAADATQALARDVTGRPERLRLDAVRLLPPLAPENKVICVGINFRKRYPLEGVPPPAWLRRTAIPNPCWCCPAAAPHARSARAGARCTSSTTSAR